MLLEELFMNQNRRVVITGMGVVTPVGNDISSTWDALCRGTSGIGSVTRFDTSAFAVSIAGEVKNFDPLSYWDKKEAKKLAYFTQYAMVAADQAWEDAKLNNHSFDKTRMGCIVGVGMGGLGDVEENHAVYMKSGPRRISPFLVPKMIPNIAPGNIAIKYALHGTNFTISSACTSGTHAIGESYRMIKAGMQDLIVTGGTESTVTPIGMGGFASMKALSTRNDQPTKASRPFDKDRDGFVLGEGAGILVLESLESAQKRGATIHGEIIGYGASCDAFHITAPVEGGRGARECMANAIQDAGLAPEQIDYINAHGTSTPANDIAESSAIEFVIGENARKDLKVSSTKSMTGHLLGAAGAVEAIFCTQAINTGVIPPTINLENPQEGCNLNYVPHEAVKSDVSIAMSNSFGFGGTNASVVVSKFQE